MTWLSIDDKDCDRLQRTGSRNWARSRAPVALYLKHRVSKWLTCRVRLLRRYANCHRGTASCSRITPSTAWVTVISTANWCSYPTFAAKSSFLPSSWAVEPSVKSTRGCRLICRRIHRDRIKQILELLLRYFSFINALPWNWKPNRM